MSKLLLTLLLIVFISCGDSHIVNDPKPRIQNANPDCELYFSSEDLCLTMKWEVMPTESSFGSIELTFTDAKNPDLLVTPTQAPFVVLWMPSMGHGSSPVTMEFIETGRFKAHEVFFIMGGPWDIRYQLRDQETVIEEVIQKIDI